MKNKIIIGIIALSFIALVVIILSSKVPKSIDITTFESAYNVVQFSDEENIEIPIFISMEDSYIINKDNVISSKIKNDQDSIAFNINRIVDTEEKALIKNKRFHKYILILNPVLKLEDDFTLEIDNAILEINYSQGINININIGSFSYYYYSTSGNDLSISKLKGLVNTYTDKLLVGVQIGLKSNTDDVIKITNIKALDTNVILAKSSIVLNKDFTQGAKIDDFLGYTYDPYGDFEDRDFNIILDKEYNLFIPLKYKKDILLNKLGFLIEYEINGVTKYFCIDDFIFFNTNLYSEKRINNLKLYTYENY